MNALAERPVARRRTKIRIWVPMLLLLALLSPLLLLAALIAAIALLAVKAPPVSTLVGLGRVLLALRGTRVQIEAPAASILIIIV